MSLIKTIALGAGSLGAILLAGTTLAQENYPTQPVRLIVGFSAGSSTDVASRLIAEELGSILGQRVVVENRPGASSNVATQAVAAAAPDGYTLLMGTVANTINTAIETAVDFTFPDDFEPIALIGAVPMILTVGPGVEAETVEELIAYARDNPGDLLYGTPGPGTAPHLSAELFASTIGSSFTHVPYGGTGQAAQDLVAGRINMMFAPASSVIAQIEAGNLRGLATSLSRRAAIAPDLPTLEEAGVEGFDTSVWFGLMAPAGTPEAIVERLAAASNQALESPAVLAAFEAQGIETLGGDNEEFSAYIAREIESWSQVASQVDLTE